MADPAGSGPVRAAGAAQLVIPRSGGLRTRTPDELVADAVSRAAQLGGGARMGGCPTVGGAEAAGSAARVRGGCRAARIRRGVLPRRAGAASGCGVYQRGLW